MFTLIKTCTGMHDKNKYSHSCVDSHISVLNDTQQDANNKDNKTKLRGFSPQANYTDRATAACRRS
jgi:hypothetical protein